MRPVDLVAPGLPGLEMVGPGEGALPQPAPYVAVVAEVDGPAELTLESVRGAITGLLDDHGRASLRVDGLHARSRRHGRSRIPVDALALAVTGAQATVFTRSAGTWTARGKVALTDRVDTSDTEWGAELRVRASGAVGRVRAGAFGQLGLRDLRLVSNADGTPYSPDARILLTATSAGPGFFGTGHASVWELDADRLELTHRSDIFFRRGEQVYGDHAIHLLRDGDAWLVATSTWGDFVDPAVDHVHVEIGRTSADLLSGRHVVDTEPLHLPTDGLHSVGVWDPHLVRDGDEWLVGYVSARRYFLFHPVVATGPSLEELTVRAALPGRRATEGTTITRLGDTWRVVASDGRENRRGHRAAYPVFDLDLHQLGTLDAPYPTNLPWPTLVPTAQGMLLVGFDGTATCGRLPGYGTHGAVVIAKEV
ncbi:hypothetical protein GCM10009798_01860 [Nocardioides panacihumi]|uniref:Uncharacterized protein n=1 Tax=Nocardioides panacihumi TaxID=400774 RepID=A0ABP5BMC0_9ACTN